MTIHHLFGREDVYVITTDHRDGATDRGPHGGAHLYAPKVEASAEWSIRPKRGFGLGLVAGRNGSESDIGLNIHLFRLGSLYLRLRSPWTRWARITDHDRDHWYEPRHYGLEIAQGSWSWVVLHLGSYNGMGRDRRWREPRVNAHTFLGHNSTETTHGIHGETTVPMPEGDYKATWQEVAVVTRYTAPLGKLRDRLRGPRTHRYINLSIEGGIPVEGKGENSWDCGMDGIMGSSGPTVQEAVRSTVDSALRYRKRYGGPFGLPRAMTVDEAAAHVQGGASRPPDPEDWPTEDADREALANGDAYVHPVTGRLVWNEDPE